MPIILIICGIYFTVKLRAFYMLHPIKFTKTLKEAAKGSGISPLRALTQALAGTLGVGNMAGVATAIVAGGAGAIFWMWVSAFCAMSIKYAEVKLGIICRRKRGKGFIGGAMYYIYDTFSKKDKRLAKALSSAFAVLCIINSLMTGTALQMQSAASVFAPKFPPLILGAIVSILALLVAVGQAEKVSKVTLGLIPFLSITYIIISSWIIIGNIERLPAVLTSIFKEAFSLKSMGGGFGGYIICRAIKYGVTRGIFSNEAGLGTSPCAHSAANTKSPHHQGCFGVFEVFADTIILCSMTAFVILLSDGVNLGLDAIPLTLYSYASLSSNSVGFIIGICVILFAFTTVICQSSYARISIEFLSGRKAFWYLYIAISALICIFGTIIPTKSIWIIADIIVSLMTTVNIICLLLNRKSI